MEVVVKHPYAIFTKLTSKEFALLKNKLTWTVGYGKNEEEKTLLFRDEEINKYYTYAGLVDPLRDLIKKYKINVKSKDEDFNLERFEINPEILVGITLFPVQMSVIEKCLIRKKGLIHAVTSCLTGDTLISTNRGGIGRKYPIKRMYNSCHGNPDKIKGLKQFDKKIKTFVRSFNGEEIRLHGINDVTYSGVRKVFKLVLENGKTLTATKDHRIMTRRGFVELGNLLVGSDMVMCDNIKPSKEKKKKSKNRVALYCSSLWHHPYANKTKVHGRSYKYQKRVLNHRAIYECHLNGLTLDEYKKIFRTDKSAAKKLKLIDPSVYDIHHKDGNYKNNDISNLLCITKEEHRKLHADHSSFGSFAPTYSKVIKVTEVGDQDTYDICCDEPYHNFSANGIIVHNSGKTEIMITVLVYLLELEYIESALIVVPSVPLADQFKERWIKRGLDENLVGVLHGKRKEYGARVTVATVNSISNGIRDGRPDILELLEKVDCLTLDECQHSRSETWSDLMLNLSDCEYVFGFSGSPFQDDDVLKTYGDALVKGLFGDIISRITYNQLRDIDLIAEPYVNFIKIKGRTSKSRAPYNNVYNKYVVKNRIRNKKVLQIMWKLKRLGFPVLALVQRKSHAIKLLNDLNDPDALCVFGNSRSVQQDQYGQLLEVPIDYDQFKREFEQGKWKTAIASQVFDEGVSIPSIGVLINVGAGKSKIRLTQRTGRGLRKKEKGLNRVYIIDFDDRGHVYMAAQSRKRKEFYEGIGAKVLDEDDFWLAVFESVRSFKKKKK